MPPLAADVVFHCQQLVEKALKGFLTWRDEPFRKTHNLVETRQQCAAVDGTLEATLRRGARLTEYAWKFRYLGEIDEQPLAEAQEALALAREVYQLVLARLPQEVRP